MSFVRTPINGTPDEAHPIVVEAGLSVLKARIPLTSPERKQLAAFASGTVVVGMLGLLALAAVVAQTRR
jgi:acyl-coenzyme A thioesterase PaaI-like protein